MYIEIKLLIVKREGESAVLPVTVTIGSFIGECTRYRQSRAEQRQVYRVSYLPGHTERVCVHRPQPRGPRAARAGPSPSTPPHGYSSHFIYQHLLTIHQGALTKYSKLIITNLVLLVPLLLGSIKYISNDSVERK